MNTVAAFECQKFEKVGGMNTCKAGTVQPYVCPSTPHRERPEGTSLGQHLQRQGCVVAGAPLPAHVVVQSESSGGRVEIPSRLLFG